MFSKQSMRLLQLVLLVPVLAILLAAGSLAVSPQLINYQGQLTDGTGNPVSDGNYSIAFTIYDAPNGGNIIWTETQSSVIVTNGVFSILLGSSTELTDVVFNDTTRYLGITVGTDPEISPRIRLVTMPYSFRTATVDGASGGIITGDVNISGKANIGSQNSNNGLNAFVAGTNDTASGDYSVVSGGDRNIASGKWTTVGGGINNEATQNQATVGGGGWNIAGHFDATVSGGDSNEALASASTVAGGASNIAEGAHSVISGGRNNLVSAPYSNISGGRSNNIQTTAGYSYLFGINSNLTEDSTFMVDMPHIRFGDEATGYEFPASDGSAGQTMSTDGLGQLSWSDAAAGDITGVTAGSGLSGGGAAGTVTLSVPTDGITGIHIASNTISQFDIATGGVGSDEIADNSIGQADIGTDGVGSSEIADGSITDADINNSAAIDPSKINGTAVNLTSNQQITGLKSFGNVAPSETFLVSIGQDFSTVDSRFGLASSVTNTSYGYLCGLYGEAYHTTAGSGGSAYGVYGYGRSDGNERFGVYGYTEATDIDINTGFSYGVCGISFDGDVAYGIFGQAAYALTNYGVYGTTFGTGTNYAGYFEGDVTVTGTLNKAGSFVQIDHPLDPENKYLIHSSVESPEMKNVYDGNVVSDMNGDAVVKLPDYFDALNRDFRYQLTVIGEFAQAIISEEINGNSFGIKTSKPNIKVSWQVTGIRKDKWAEANRIQVEVDKPTKERGLYIHPEAYGLGEEKDIHYEMKQKDRKAMESGRVERDER